MLILLCHVIAMMFQLCDCRVRDGAGRAGRPLGQGGAGQDGGRVRRDLGWDRTGRRVLERDGLGGAGWGGTGWGGAEWGGAEWGVK